MRGRPDYGKESPDYAVGFTEYLSFLTEEELGWLTHPRDGLHTVCKYLPTPADVAEFLKAKRDAANNTFRNPEPSGAYAYFKPDYDADKPLPVSEQERRARVVREALGYNPVERRKDKTMKRELTEPTAEDIANLKVAKATKNDLTPQLRAMLEAEGWPFIPQAVPTEYPPQEQAA